MPRSSGVIWDTKEVERNIVTLVPKLEAGLTVITDRVAQETQDYMRLNAPWEDQTSNARNGLFAKGISEPGRHVVVAYHTMPYGVWLELKWSGKFGILPQAIQHNGIQAMQYVNGLLSRMV